MRLELQESLPIGIESRFNNLVNELGNGAKQVFVGWDQPLLKFDLSRSLPDTTAEVKTYLSDSFKDVKGASGVFRYQDPSDYQATSIPTESGISTDRSWGLAIANTDGSQYQLYKVYELEGVRSYRPITRPVDNVDFKLYDGGIEMTAGFVIDWEAGVIMLDVPDPNLDLTWDGAFDVPVRFSQDAIAFVKELRESDCSEELFEIPSFELEEVRERSIIHPQPPVLPERLIHDFAIALDIKQQESLSTNTTITVFDSGWESRESNYQTTEDEIEVARIFREFTTGEEPLADEAELHYLICWWRCTRGGAIGCQYQGYEVQARGSLSISVELEASNVEECSHSGINDREAVYDLGSLGFIESGYIPPQLTIPTLPDFFVEFATFEISDFGITENSQTISTNSYGSQGGKSWDTSSGGSGGSGSGSGGFAASFGSVGTSLDALPNAYTYNGVQSLNFIDKVPVLAVLGKQPNSISWKPPIRQFPYLGLPRGVESGKLAFQVIDPFSSDPTVASNTVSYSELQTTTIYSRLHNFNDTLAMFDINGKGYSRPWIFSVKKIGSGFTVNTDFILANTASAIPSVFSHTGNNEINVLGQLGNTYQPKIFDGIQINFHYTNLNGEAYEPINLGDNRNISTSAIMPTDVALNGWYAPSNQLYSHLKPYIKPFYYFANNNLYKGTSNSTRDLLFSFNSATLVSFTVDTATQDYYAIALVNGNNPDLPHNNITSGTAEAYYLAIRIKPQAEIEFLGSWKKNVVDSNFGAVETAKIFGGNPLTTKGMFCNIYGYLLDLVNGGIISLKSNPAFFQDATLKTSADKNGFGFYSSSQNKIGYLAINRA